MSNFKMINDNEMRVLMMAAELSLARSISEVVKDNPAILNDPKAPAIESRESIKFPHRIEPKTYSHDDITISYNV